MSEVQKTLDHSPTPDSLALILAGGTGARLAGLTAWRAKPAVPFGGHFRTIDFTLSNCINSGVRQIALLTQYKSQSLIRHVQSGWGFLRRELGEFLDIWPAQQRQGERWYSGSGDATQQNLDLIMATDRDYVLILPGDHVYAMDYAVLLDQHVANRADVTVGCVELPLAEAVRYGVLAIDEHARVRAFGEKDVGPVLNGGGRSTMLASMGVYVFSREFLFDCLTKDAAHRASTHDFAFDILPAAIAGARVFAHPFRDLFSGRPGYWRDVGTVDSYWQAHMDLLEDPPKLNLFDDRWPIRTHQVPVGPTYVQGSVRLNAAILGHGCTIAGEISRSVLSTNCRIGKHSRITNSVLLPNVQIGEGCSLDHVVVDSNCTVPDGTIIGSNAVADADHCVSPQGVVLITQGATAHRRLSVPRKVA